MAYVPVLVLTIKYLVIVSHVSEHREFFCVGFVWFFFYGT